MLGYYDHEKFAENQARHCSVKQLERDLEEGAEIWDVDFIADYFSEDNCTDSEVDSSDEEAAMHDAMFEMPFNRESDSEYDEEEAVEPEKLNSL